MNYHGIIKDDMLNGTGLRVVVFVSGCTHHCNGCHNPETWEFDSGVKFNEDNLETIFDYSNNDHIEGLTLSGGDPLHISNICRENESDITVFDIITKFKKRFKDKNIWVYTGYTYEQLLKFIVDFKKADNLDLKLYSSLLELLMKDYIDVLVEGEYQKDLNDINYKWAGSTNQRIIKCKESIKKDSIVLFNN